MTEGLTEEQRALLESWLGHYRVVRDHSWPLQDTTVLQLETAYGDQVIIKASETSHHIRREIAAYSRGLPGLDGNVPVMLHAAPGAGLLVTRYLPGAVVAGTPAEDDAQTYRQAGELLRLLHQPAGTSGSYLRSLSIRTSSMLDKAHGLLARPVLRALASAIAAVEHLPVEVVTTHGDYQPRNWLHDAGTIRVIDFGRAELRPWVHDLVRLGHQQFLEQPGLSAAFHEGLGRLVDTEEEWHSWQLENLNQAVGTVVWAHHVGDRDFEQQGVRMVERVLDGFEPYPG
jgi:Ser/Thr protein kinase RdoA (MazF antagonist)